MGYNVKESLFFLILGLEKCRKIPNDSANEENIRVDKSQVPD